MSVEGGGERTRGSNLGALISCMERGGMSSGGTVGSAQCLVELERHLSELKKLILLLQFICIACK